MVLSIYTRLPISEEGTGTYQDVSLKKDIDLVLQHIGLIREYDTPLQRQVLQACRLLS